MPYGVAAAPAGPRISLHIEQALAKSALPEIPHLTKAARESHFSIVTELTEWAHDHDPIHLLRIIAMQQYMLHADRNAIASLATEARVAHGVLREMAGHLDHGGGVGSQPLYLADLSRRMPAMPSPHSDTIPVVPVAQAHPQPATLDTQSLLAQQEFLFQQLQHLETSMQNVAVQQPRSVTDHSS